MDMATRYPEAISLRRVDTISAVGALLHLFGHFGLPKDLLSDRGTNFTSKLMQETVKKHGVGRILASPCHQESNGIWHSTFRDVFRGGAEGARAPPSVGHAQNKVQSKLYRYLPYPSLHYFAYSQVYKTRALTRLERSLRFHSERRSANKNHTHYFHSFCASAFIGQCTTTTS